MRDDAPRDGQPQRAETAVLHVGALKLDLASFRVTVAQRDVAMTRGEFLLLAELVSHPYCVLERRRLAAALQRQGLLHPISTASLRAVDVKISHIRKKLRQAGCDCIHTMRFVGYRFVPVDC